MQLLPSNDINLYRKQNEVIFELLLTKSGEICRTEIYKDGEELF